MTTTVAPPPVTRTSGMPVGTQHRTAESPVADEHAQAVFATFDKAYAQNWETFAGKFWWERYPPDHRAYANLCIARNRRVVELAAGGQAALDVGSGMGDILYQLKSKYAKLRGIDPSAMSCRVAEDNFARRGVSQSHEFRQGLAENLPYADGEFDLVTCLDTYEHIEPAQRHRALLEARRVLAPNGRLMIATPSRRYLRVLALLDNVLTLRRQVRCWRDPKLKRPVEWIAMNKKDYCEVFCTSRELTRDLRDAGFEIERFERVGFYPAPERGGFIYWCVNGKSPESFAVRASVAFVNLVERLGVFGQKMLVVARPAGSSPATVARKQP